MAANSPTGSTLERVRSARFIEAASRNEQFYSASRLALCTAALARNVWLSTAGATPASEGLTLQIGLVSALAAVSIVLLIASCRGPISLQLRLLSAGADLAVITAALAQNALYAETNYPGLLSLPDMAGLTFPVLASGFRFCPKPVLLIGMLSLVALCGLAAFDVFITGQAGPRGLADGSMVAGLIIGATVVGVIVAKSLYGQAEAVATAEIANGKLNAAVEVAIAANERAEANLARYHSVAHELKTLVSVVRFDVDLITRSLTETLQGGERPLDSATSRLRTALAGVQQQLNDLRDRRPADWKAEGEIAPAMIHRAIRAAAGKAEQFFPALTLTVPPVDWLASAAVAGGERALRRVLFSLLSNAAEGDGQLGAKNVAVAVTYVDSGFRIEVQDDGPGFPFEILSDPCVDFDSTKRGGWRSGLKIVHETLRASGGHLECSNVPGGGACVVAWIPEFRDR